MNKSIRSLLLAGAAAMAACPALAAEVTPIGSPMPTRSHTTG